MKDLKNKNVLIIGDSGVDHYIIGEATRLSPEAPVPVLTNIIEEFRPGLAANVASNVKALGSTPTLVSVVSDTYTALTPLMDVQEIRRNMVVDEFRKTTMKTRIMAGQTQLVRVDDETTDPINMAIENKIIEAIEYEMARTDIVIVQDYNKGMINRNIMTKIRKLADHYGLMVLVDPHSKQDPSIYFRADVLTPNKQECFDLTSKFKPNSIETAANQLQSMSNAKSVLVTLGKDGMFGWTSYKENFSIKAHAENVVDVTGAGDTVIAALAIGLAVGLDFRNAVEMANHAASVVVKKLGTSVCTKEELLRSLKERF